MFTSGVLKVGALLAFTMAAAATAKAQDSRFDAVTYSGTGNMTWVDFESGCDPDFSPETCGEIPQFNVGQRVDFFVGATVERDRRSGKLLSLSIESAGLSGISESGAFGFIDLALGWSPAVGSLEFTLGNDGCGPGDQLNITGYSFFFYGVRCGVGVFPSGYPFEDFRGGGRITSITVNGVAVPEPATWAMMITGFGMVGRTMRRRRPVPA